MTMPALSTKLKGEAALGFSAATLKIDAAAEVDRIARAVREQILRQLRRRGAVIGLSGGIDSSVTAALAVHAVGSKKVLHTGDFFRADEEGFLYFVGRKDDIIKTRGEKVSPKEVENAIHSLDGVHEVAVIGVPDAVLGQAVKARITLLPGAAVTERMVMQHCQQRLESFMVPKFVEFLDELPKSDNGKIRKTEPAQAPA